MSLRTISVWVLASVVAVPAVYAGTLAPPTCVKPTAAEGADLASLDELFQEEVLLATPASAGVDGKTAGGLGASEKPGGTECDWYWIDCGWDGEIDDWCCGSFNSCWDYCEELCGGECEPALPE